MTSVLICRALAEWAERFTPGPADRDLAQRSLADTLGVTLAARDHPIGAILDTLPEAGRWSVLAHVLDFDDLHIDSTTHISAVIVPAVLSSGGDARAYLAGAGVMARLGELLGWSHYAAGWHATCTAGAPAAAVAAGIAWGFSAGELAAAMALAIPAAGGVHAAFGTHAKALQVGFATAGGVRAARLVRAGACSDPRALDQWLQLVGGHPAPLGADGPAIPGGLAVKLFPCCYASQRPIAAIRAAKERIDDEVDRVVVTTPEAAVLPLVHERPHTGLEGKFSLPYAVASAILDEYPNFASFSDVAVNRPEAQRMIGRVETHLTAGGSTLLDGDVEVRIELHDGRVVDARLALPSGAPDRPPTAPELRDKLAVCDTDAPALLSAVTWESAREVLENALPRHLVSAREPI